MGLRESWRARHWTWALALACLGTTAGPSALTNDLCGTTVVADLTLDHDLTCVGDGLTVGADGITIDLNGYTIAGSGAGIGIAVTGRADVSIQGGTLSRFAVAVRTNTSTDIVIKHVQFVDNPEGIDFQAGSIGNTVKDSAFTNSTTRAIMLRSNSRDNDIKSNTFTGNRVGILVFGGIDNTLKNNIVSGSSVAGIRINVIATGNVVKDNWLGSNAAGVEFLVTPTGSATGNELKDNTITMNSCGLKGPTEENLLKDNTFEANVADICS